MNSKWLHPNGGRGVLIPSLAYDEVTGVFLDS